MDRIIGKISLIENKAVKIMDDAAARKKDIAEQIRRETESFDRELEAETSARIDEVRTSMEAEMKKKIVCLLLGVISSFKVLGTMNVCKMVVGVIQLSQQSKNYIQIRKIK